MYYCIFYILGQKLDTLADLVSKLNSKLDENFADIKETHAKDYSVLQVSLEAIGASFCRDQPNVDMDNGDLQFDTIFPIRSKIDFDEFESKLRSDNLYRVKLVRPQ